MKTDFTAIINTKRKDFVARVDKNMATVLPEYHGEYVVIPTVEEQVLQTEKKWLSQDIVVKEIPSNYGRLIFDGKRIICK